MSRALHRLRRRLLLSVVAAMAAMTSLAAAAAGWPERPLRLIVPFPPGGAADIIGRLVAKQLTERLGQTVVVENRPGGGTVLAGQLVAHSAPDGYTLSLATTGQLAVAPALQANLPYDPVRSFTPVALVASTAYVISVNANSPIQTLAQLIATARQKPGALAFSSCGVGTVCQLVGEQLKVQAGVDLLHVPYAGSAPAMTALMSDQVQVGSDTVAINAPYIQAGKLRGLVVTSTRRSDIVPNVPTAAEAGLPGFVSSSWFGVVVPAGTAPDIVARLNMELNTITDSAETKKLLAQQGLESLHSTPEQFGKQIAADLVTWGQIVRTAKVKVD